jgi:hypothetical protein
MSGSASATSGRRGRDGGVLPRLPQPVRKVMLVAHVALSVAWLGIEAALLVLGVTGLVADDPERARAAFVAMGLLTLALAAPLSLLALLTGVLLGLGTPWGLLKHWWVLVKLLVGCLLVAGGLAFAYPRFLAAAERAMAGTGLGRVRFQVVVAPSVAIVLLLLATTLSVVKPWGRTARGRRGLRSRSAAVAGAGRTARGVTPARGQREGA